MKRIKIGVTALIAIMAMSFTLFTGKWHHKLVAGDEVHLNAGELPGTPSNPDLERQKDFFYTLETDVTLTTVDPDVYCPVVSTRVCAYIATFIPKNPPGQPKNIYIITGVIYGDPVVY
ncbi:MAG: hypothetical protein QM731_05135 [Chitinophagaceae bacterium]